MIILNPKNKEPRTKRTVSAEELAKRRIGGPSAKGYDPLLEPGRQRSMQGYASRWDPWKSWTPEEKEALKKTYRDSCQSKPSYPVQGSPPRWPRFNWSDKFNSEPNYDFEIRKMLAKDPRVNANDKYMIVKAASRRTIEIGKDGKTLGDIVRDEVEKYLADMAKPVALASYSHLPQMDPEAAVRQLKEFAESSSIRLSYINMYMVFGFEPYGYRKYEIELMLPVLNCIPKARLDENVGAGLTLRELVKKVGETAISSELQSAARNILKNE